MWAEAGRAGGRTVSKLANTSTERDLSDSHSCSRCVGDARQYPGSNSDRNSGDLPRQGRGPLPTQPYLLQPLLPRRPAQMVGQQFSSQPANEYLQSYDAYISDFKMAYHAMKQGDMTKYQNVILRAHELQTKGEKLGGELSPDEEKRFADYLNKKADELAQFASQNR